MWNILDLKCPLEDFSEYPPQDRYIIEELQEFVALLSKAADSLTSENSLWTEMQALHNIQIKYKRLLRCDKCLVHLQRVSHCLKKMVLLNLSRWYLDLAERFLLKMQDFSWLSVETVKLPSRQQLEYVLLRTLTASKLISEGIKYSRETFCILVQKLKVGHLIMDLVMATSLTARLNILLRAILDKLCSVYKQALSWRFKLKAGTFVWPKKLFLPADLGEWLKTFESECLQAFPMSEDDVDMLTNLVKTGNKSKEKNKDQDSTDSESVIVLQNLLNPVNSKVIKNDNEDSDSESIVIVDDISWKRKSSDVTSGSKSTEDCGEVVPRKKVKTEQSSAMHSTLLQKIVRMKSLKELEILWTNIQGSPGANLPKPLTEGKRKAVERLFSHIETAVSKKHFKKVFDKKKPQYFIKARLLFCKHLGFNPEVVELCIRDFDAFKERPVVDIKDLVPVKTLKQLKVLYQQLFDFLKSTHKNKKKRKLKEFFKQKISDIRLLKRNGEKKTVRKLIFCTSKLLLTWCKE